MKICGMIEDYFEEKFNEAWNSPDGTPFKNLKIGFYGVMGGVPAGLMVVGAELYLAAIVMAFHGKKLDWVDKK